jgi:hypothetical protein
LLEQQLPSLQPSVALASVVPQHSPWQPLAQHDLSSQQPESQSPEAQASGLQVQSLQHDLGAVCGDEVRLKATPPTMPHTTNNPKILLVNIEKLQKSKFKIRKSEHY